MNERELPAMAWPVELTVMPMPVAWWERSENGNIRCWTSAHAESLRLARETGFELEPLYDQAALDAAVAAERERGKAKAIEACNSACGVSPGATGSADR